MNSDWSISAKKIGSVKEALSRNPPIIQESVLGAGEGDLYHTGTGQAPEKIEKWRHFTPRLPSLRLSNVYIRVLGIIATL